MFTKPNGYTDCVACTGAAFDHVLCGWCKAGAYEYNADPDSVYDEDFDEEILGFWAAAGEMIAGEEDSAYLEEEYRERQTLEFS